MGAPSFRQRYVSDPLFDWFKASLPPLSETEQIAMRAGSLWWDAELFKGAPNWQKLLEYPSPQLSDEEQAFIDNQLVKLLGMLDDFDIVQQRKDLPPYVWQYLKQEKFLSLIIPKRYGGLAFSALANATIVAKIASKSLSAAVSVMVPNSLGPGELLTHYGTEEQKDYWLPRLASGEELPCFALTGIHAGSDAGSIEDSGEICLGEYEGEQTLGVRLNWNKRYITLAPVASVLGLAFKLYDPNKMLGDTFELGITCALIPTKHQGVQIGKRHNPLGLGFMNGPTQGRDVFIPLNWVIGGQDFVGQGWKMLMECLSAGRGISLPALASAIAQTAARTSGAYAAIREQFNSPIGRFEGVAQALGRIGGFTYMIEATRSLTTTSIDLGENPAIITAMTKYHTTELARIVLNDAMDIHAGRAIQQGPLNYLANHYFGMPVAITVEGANILTRNLIIFGQGAVRCHPFILSEMQAVSEPNEQQGRKDFDKLLFKHIAYTGKNALLAFANALSRSFFNTAPSNDETSHYYRQLTRFSRAMSVASDIAMLALGGELKKKEMLSARFGDILSHLYIGSAVLKHYQNQGQQRADLPLVHYAMQYCLHQCAQGFDEVLQNFPHKYIGLSLKALLFPFGFHYPKPSDSLSLEVSKILMENCQARDRLCALSFFEPNQADAVGLVEMAFVAKAKAKAAQLKIKKAVKSGFLEKKARDEMIAHALAQGIILEHEAKLIFTAEKLKNKAIQVDSFAFSWFSQNRKKKMKKTMP